MELFGWMLDLVGSLWGANETLSESDPLAESRVARETRALHRRLFLAATLLILAVAAVVACISMSWRS